MTKNIIKMIVNIVLTGLFLALVGLYATGQHMHQILGIITLVVFIIHITLSFPMLKSVAKNLFSKKLVFKTKLSFIINILIFAGLVIIMITGPKMSDGESMHQMSLALMRTRFLHSGVTYIMLGLIGIHIGLHINQMSAMFKSIKPSKKVSQILALITVIVCLSAGLLGIVKGDYFRSANPVISSEMTEMFKDFESNQPELGEHERPADDHENDEKREYPEPMKKAGRAKILYALLSMIFFATLTFVADKLFSRKKA